MCSKYAIHARFSGQHDCGLNEHLMVWPLTFTLIMNNMMRQMATERMWISTHPALIVYFVPYTEVSAQRKWSKQHMSTLCTPSTSKTTRRNPRTPRSSLLQSLSPQFWLCGSHIYMLHITLNLAREELRPEGFMCHKVGFMRSLVEVWPGTWNSHSRGLCRIGQISSAVPLFVASQVAGLVTSGPKSMRSESRIHYVNAWVGPCVVQLHHIQNQVFTTWLEVSECQFEACHKEFEADRCDR